MMCMLINLINLRLIWLINRHNTVCNFCWPYAKLSTGGVSRGYERMDEKHLSMFHSVSNRARGKRSRNSVSSVARYAFNSFF